MKYCVLTIPICITISYSRYVHLYISMYILMQVILKKCSNVYGFYVEKTSLYNNLVL